MANGIFNPPSLGPVPNPFINMLRVLQPTPTVTPPPAVAPAAQTPDPGEADSFDNIFGTLREIMSQAGQTPAGGTVRTPPPVTPERLNELAQVFGTVAQAPAEPAQLGPPPPVAPLLEVDVAPETLEAAASPEATPEALAEAEKGFFDDPANKQFLLGVGIGIAQGRNIGDALLLGTQLKNQAMASQVAAGEASEERQLKRAQTRKALAEAQKIIKDTGSDSEAGKQFNTSLRTRVGEQPIGEENILEIASVQAANDTLARFPDNEAMQRIKRENLQVLVRKALASEDPEEVEENLAALETQFPNEDLASILREAL